MSNATESPPFEFDDYSQRVVVAIMYLIVSLLGLFGNTMVILAVLLSRKVRTSTNAFVVNLSVADLLACAVAPLDAAVLLGKDGPPFGEWVCGIVTFVKLTSIGCSMFTLAFIGINRLVLITKPMTLYPKVYTPKKIAVWLGITWLIPIVLDILPLLLNIGGFVFSPRYHVCGSNTSHPAYKIYNIIIIALLNIIPLSTIIVCYVLIWKHLIRHSKMLVMASATEHVSSTTDSPPPVTVTTDMDISEGAHHHHHQPEAGASSDPRSHVSRRQNQITKNMFYVVCAFIICLIPYTVSVFFGHNFARPYLFALLLFNSCVNPMIYASKHRDFKAIFSCIVRRKWNLIPEPSDTLKSLRRKKCCGCQAMK